MSTSTRGARCPIRLRVIGGRPWGLGLGDPLFQFQPSLLLPCGTFPAEGGDCEKRQVVAGDGAENGGDEGAESFDSTEY